MDYKDIIKQELKKVSQSKFSKLSDAKLEQLNNIVSKGGKAAYAKPDIRKKFIESGKIQGKKNAESGFLDSIRTKEGCILGGKKGLEAQCIKLICPHCKKEGKGRVMYKWHFEKCKSKPI